MSPWCRSSLSGWLSVATAAFFCLSDVSRADACIKDLGPRLTARGDGRVPVNGSVFLALRPGLGYESDWTGREAFSRQKPVLRGSEGDSVPLEYRQSERISHPWSHFVTLTPVEALRPETTYEFAFDDPEPGFPFSARWLAARWHTMPAEDVGVPRFHPAPTVHLAHFEPYRNFTSCAEGNEYRWVLRVPAAPGSVPLFVHVEVQRLGDNHPRRERQVLDYAPVVEFTLSAFGDPGNAITATLWLQSRVGVLSEPAVVELTPTRERLSCGALGSESTIWKYLSSREPPPRRFGQPSTPFLDDGKALLAVALSLLGVMVAAMAGRRRRWPGWIAAFVIATAIACGLEAARGELAVGDDVMSYAALAGRPSVCRRTQRSALALFLIPTVICGAGLVLLRISGRGRARA